MLKTILNKPLEMFNTVARWCDHLPGSRTFPSPQGESLHPLNSGPAPLVRGQPLARALSPCGITDPGPGRDGVTCSGPLGLAPTVGTVFPRRPTGGGAGLPAFHGRVLFPGAGLLRRGRPRTSSRTPRRPYPLAAVNEHPGVGWRGPCAFTDPPPPPVLVTSHAFCKGRPTGLSPRWA